jgi:DNA repair exonuclease SbcCD ATPase subunit
MQLSGPNRRDVIEDLLDIRIFTAMNNVIKDKIRLVRDDIKTLTLKKESLNDKVAMQENFIQELETNSKERIEKKRKKMDALGDDICVYIMENERSDDLVFGYTEDQEKLGTGKETLAKLNNYKGQISNKVSTITKEHKFFTDNVTCPTCTQSIEEEFRLNKIKDAQTKAKELQSGYQELEEAIKKEQEREHQFTVLSKEITKLTHGISKNNTLISNCQRQQRDLESEIQTLTSQLENRNTEQNKLEKFKSTLQETYESLATQNQTIKYYNFTYELLKDGGVKTKIIKKYLPLINQQVNRYLQMMDFYINFTLDDEFNETIESPIHEDFSYSSFSEGEKQRIDLALLFTWREVAKFKNSVATNLMILDEVFDSSLDATGTEEFLKIIRYVIKDANIFIISHKSGLEDKFEDHIRFEKHKGFSRIIS